MEECCVRGLRHRVGGGHRWWQFAESVDAYKGLEVALREVPVDLTQFSQRAEARVMRKLAELPGLAGVFLWVVIVCLCLRLYACICVTSVFVSRVYALAQNWLCAPMHVNISVCAHVFTRVVVCADYLSCASDEEREGGERFLEVLYPCQ